MISMHTTFLLVREFTKISYSIVIDADCPSIISLGNKRMSSRKTILSQRDHQSV
jgi:hypothetical protein